MMGASGIQVKKLSVRYPHAPSCALKDASLSLSPGSLSALVGANGAGKSIGNQVEGKEEVAKCSGKEQFFFHCYLPRL